MPPNIRNRKSNALPQNAARLCAARRSREHATAIRTVSTMPGLDCNAAGRRQQGRDDLDQRRVGRADACMALVAQGKRLPVALIPILVLRSQQWTEPLQAEVGDRSETQAGLRLFRAKALGRGGASTSGANATWHA